jgi:hypothetical protein
MRFSLYCVYKALQKNGLHICKVITIQLKQYSTKALLILKVFISAPVSKEFNSTVEKNTYLMADCSGI